MSEDGVTDPEESRQSNHELGQDCPRCEESELVEKKWSVESLICEYCGAQFL